MNDNNVGTTSSNCAISELRLSGTFPPPVAMQSISRPDASSVQRGYCWASNTCLNLNLSLGITVNFNILEDNVCFLNLINVMSIFLPFLHQSRLLHTSGFKSTSHCN